MQRMCALHMCSSDCSLITLQTCVEKISELRTHTAHIRTSESSSFGCRVANGMLSSALPAGRHTLSITGEYRRLLSKGLEDLGCPNQSPDLSPCSDTELN